jgi:hypothetical protein
LLRSRHLDQRRAAPSELVPDVITWPSETVFSITVPLIWRAHRRILESLLGEVQVRLCAHQLRLGVRVIERGGLVLLGP